MTSSLHIRINGEPRGKQRKELRHDKKRDCK